jgi:DNA-binding NtrC family response regulator
MDSKNLSGNGKRILVVDDDPTILEMLLDFFSSYGFTASLAVNAEIAFELFNKEKGNFDLLFTDIFLPGMSGLELAGKLILKKPDLPILLGSCYVPEKSQQREIKEKGYPFVKKPYSINALLNTVNRLTSA